MSGICTVGCRFSIAGLLPRARGLRTESPWSMGVNLSPRCSVLERELHFLHRSTTMTGFFVTLAAGIIGYLLARRFVSRRLRFVDAVQSRFAPLVAAVAGAVSLLPPAALPP